MIKKEKGPISEPHFWGSTAWRLGCQCEECKYLNGLRMEK